MIPVLVAIIIMPVCALMLTSHGGSTVGQSVYHILCGVSHQRLDGELSLDRIKIDVHQ